MTMMIDDYLIHYGVPGMKWGVRKKSSSNGKSSKPKKMGKRKKVAIAVGVVGTVAVGSVLVNHYLKKYGNTTIKAGKDFQHMSRTVDAMLDKPFYASYLKSDNKQYAKADFFGSHWNYKNTLTSDKNIKVAGKKVAEKTYVDWVRKNSDIKDKLKKTNPNINFQNNKAIKKTYDNFNRNFLSPDIRDRSLRDSYFKELTKKGYDAVRDRNDQIYSNMKSPIMVFNRLGDVKVKDIKKIK